MKKRILTLALTVMMIVTLIPLGTAVNAAGPVTVTFDTGELGCRQVETLEFEKGKSILDVVPFDYVNLGTFESRQFYGWSLEKEVYGKTQPEFDLETPINSDTVLYPIWVPAVDSVQGILNQSDVPKVGDSVPESVTVSTYEMPDQTYVITDAYWCNLNGTPYTYSTFKEGVYYLFVCFAPTDGNLFRDTDGHMLNDTLSLKSVTLDVSGVGRKEAAFTWGGKYVAYAYFTFEIGNPNTYTVTFDANGHGMAPAPITVPYGKTLKDVLGIHVDAISNNMFEDGYAFEGWYNEEILGDFLFPETTEILGDITVKAMWSEVATVSEVKLNIRTPAVGETFAQLLNEGAFVAVDPDCHAWFNGYGAAVSRRDGTPFYSESAFEAGKEYKVTIPLEVDNNYCFAGGRTYYGNRRAGNLTVLINDGIMNYAPYEYNEFTAVVTYYFTPATGSDQPISRADFDVIRPIAGENGSFNSLSIKPAQAGFVQSEVAFYEKDSLGNLQYYYGILEYGVEYTFTVTLLAKDGYEFASGMEAGIISGAKFVSCECKSPRTVKVTGVVSPRLPFTDVPEGKWYTGAVGFCYTWGIMAGTSATTFDPDGAVTRAMFVTILSRIDGADVSSYTSSDFIDVPVGKWYSKPIQWAFENGYASGMGGGRFCPNDPVTREQLAQFLYNYSQKKGYPTEHFADISGYPDAGKVSNYAKDAVRWAVGNGLISGIKSGDTVLLSPKTGATRAQVAQITLKYLQNIIGSLI